MGRNDNSFNLPELKRRPIFKEVVIESGHPEITVENLTGKVADMGYSVSSYGSSITSDDVADGVKDFRESLQAVRSEDHYRENAKKYKMYSFICLGISILLSFLFFSTDLNNTIGFLTIIGWILTIILFILAKPKIKSDTIWIKVAAKVYSGTKSRELRDAGSHSAGQTKAASSVYVHSELKLIIAADSEIGVERVREDVGAISKYLQKL